MVSANTVLVTAVVIRKVNGKFEISRFVALLGAFFEAFLSRVQSRRRAATYHCGRNRQTDRLVMSVTMSSKLY